MHFQVQLNIGMVPEGGRMVAKIMMLEEEDEKGMDPRVWAEEGGYGLLNSPPIKIRMKPNILPTRIRQKPYFCTGKTRVNTSN